MRVHRLLAEASAGILRSVFRERKVLDHELGAAFQLNKKWGKRDRGFVAETVFEVARWRRSLEFVAGSGEVTALCAAQWVRMGLEVPEWWNHKGGSAEEMNAREAELAGQARAVRESVPDWLDELGERELGKAWDGELAALNRRAPVFLRVNSLQGERESAQEWLGTHGVETAPVDGAPDALVLPSGKILPKALRKEGRVEIQDAGSQLISALLGVKPGERVIDACSGAGGKALHLAALMGNEGRVYGMDVDGRKLEELKRRAKRAGATCIVTKPIQETTPEDFAEVADRLLIDAPCSGLGTLRRQPDLKWRLRPAQLERVRGIQRKLLAEYPAMLKPGGTLVYATCSILPSENREAVQVLLEQGGFSLEEELVISPAEMGFDGFYAAVLRKTG